MSKKLFLLVVFSLSSTAQASNTWSDKRGDGSNGGGVRERDEECPRTFVYSYDPKVRCDDPSEEESDDLVQVCRRERDNFFRWKVPEQSRPRRGFSRNHNINARSDGGTTIVVKQCHLKRYLKCNPVDSVGVCGASGHLRGIDRVRKKLLKSSRIRNRDEPINQLPPNNMDLHRADSEFVMVWNVQKRLKNIEGSGSAIQLLSDALEGLNCGEISTSANMTSKAIQVIQQLTPSEDSCGVLDATTAKNMTHSLVHAYKTWIERRIISEEDRGELKQALEREKEKGDDLVGKDNFSRGVQAYGGALSDFKNLGVEIFDLDLFEQNIKEELKALTTGYAYSISQNGQQVSEYFLPSGFAISAGDGGPVPFTATREVNIASVMKPITAAAVLQLIEKHPNPAVTVDSLIADFLPPNWEVGPGSDELTFRDLLSQQSGLPDYDVADPFQPCTQAEMNAGPEMRLCGLRQMIKLGPSPIKSSGLTVPVAYKNQNFAMMKALLPRLWGVNPNPPNEPGFLSYASILLYYINFILFEPMNIGQDNLVSGVTNEPNPTLLYDAANQPEPGVDAGNWNDLLGGGGLWMTTVDMNAFLAHRLYNNDVLLPSTRQIMNDGLLGWRRVSGTPGPGSTAGDPLVIGQKGVYLTHDGLLQYFCINNDPDFCGVETAIMAFPNNVEIAISINNLHTSRPWILWILRDAFDAAWHA